METNQNTAERKTTYTDSEKLQMVLNHLKLKPSQFADQAEISRSLMSMMLGVKSPATKSLTEDTILKIIKRYPIINYRFLKTGQLPMMNLTDEQIKNQENLLGGEKPIYGGNKFETDIATMLAYNNEMLQDIREGQDETNALLARIAEALEKK